jgi:hypothetical protein
LDYILGFEDSPFAQDFDETITFSKFFDRICESEDTTVALLVFNLLSWETKVVCVTPSLSWKGADGLLGLKLRLEALENCTTSIFRVLKYECYKNNYLLMLIKYFYYV